MKKIKIILVVFVSIILLNGGCSSMKIMNVNKEVDFSLSNYNTYDFHKLDIDTVAYAKFYERLVLLKTELMNQLEEDGLKRVTENPELLINVGIYLEKKQQTEETYIANARYMGPRNYQWEGVEDVVADYKEGTFTIDFVKAKDNTLECMAVAEGVVVEKDKEAKKNIHIAVNNLFKKINKE